MEKNTYFYLLQLPIQVNFKCTSFSGLVQCCITILRTEKPIYYCQVLVGYRKTKIRVLLFLVLVRRMSLFHNLKFRRNSGSLQPCKGFNANYEAVRLRLRLERLETCKAPVVPMALASRRVNSGGNFIIKHDQHNSIKNQN